MKENPREHSMKNFVHTYKFQSFDYVTISQHISGVLKFKH